MSDKVKSGRISGTGLKGLSLSLKYIFVTLGTLHDLPCLYSSSQMILKLSPSARGHFMTLIEIVVLLITWTYLSDVALCKIYLIYTLMVMMIRSVTRIIIFFASECGKFKSK